MIEQPPTLFSARRIITLAGDEPEALAVNGERIVATSAASDLRQGFAHAEHVWL